MSTEKVEITLFNNAKITCPSGTTVREALAVYNQKALITAIAAKINGLPVDLSYPLREAAKLDLIESSSPEGLHILRHSTAHVMAQAVQDIFKSVKIAIGPAIEDGFYYDFDYAESFTPADLENIEARMGEIIAADHAFQRREVSREEALSLFSERGDVYKVEIINDLP